MKRNKLIIIFCAAIIFGSTAVMGQPKARLNAYQYNNAAAAGAAQEAAEARANAIRQQEATRLNQWRKENPWWNDPRYKDYEFKITQMGQIIRKNHDELSLLEQAGLGMSARGAQLKMWINNEYISLSVLVDNVRKLKATYKLNEYYKDHPIQPTTTTNK